MTHKQEAFEDNLSLMIYSEGRREARMSENREICANCGEPIGALETPHVWRDQVVCKVCNERLRDVHAAALAVVHDEMEIYSDTPTQRPLGWAFLVLSALTAVTLFLIWTTRPPEPVTSDSFREGISHEDPMNAVWPKVRKWHGAKIRAYGSDIRDFEVGKDITLTFTAIDDPDVPSPIRVYYVCTFPDTELEKLKMLRDQRGAHFQGKVHHISLSWPDDNPTMRVIWVNLRKCKLVSRS